jgi:hypothetical protein
MPVERNPQTSVALDDLHGNWTMMNPIYTEAVSHFV